MAFNLKGLFSKLKPAAKTVANYGDDAAKALTTYGDDVSRVVDSADDLVRRGLIPANKQTATGDALEALYNYQTANGTPILAPDDVLDDMYLASSGNSYVASSNPNLGIRLYTPGTESDSYLRKFGDTDWTLNTDYWGRQHPIRKQDLVNDSFLQLDADVRQSGLPATPAEWDELTSSLSNPDIMDSIDTALQFGNPITNFSDTSSYIDQMVSPTPNWTSRWGALEPYDERLKSLYDQLRGEFDRWTDFSHSYGFTPPHVNYDDLADQIMKLESLRDSGRWWKGPLN